MTNKVAHSQLGEAGALLMNERIQQLMANLKKNPGANESQIRSLEATLGVSFPSEFRSFLAFSNGAEGFIGPNAYLVLWSTEQMLELNSAYSLPEFAPELVLFATNGGGTGYAFDKRHAHFQIVEVPLLGMSTKTAVNRGSTLEQFLSYLQSS